MQFSPPCQEQVLEPRDQSRRDVEVNWRQCLSFDRVFVTPNALTEASNLLNKKPRDARLLPQLRKLIEISKEIVVVSAAAARNSAFARLGLADTALLEVVSEERPLITVDLELYTAALAQGKGKETAFNFTHLQGL